MKTPKPVKPAESSVPIRDTRSHAPLAGSQGARPPSTTRDETDPIPAERRILALMGEIRRVGRWIVPRVFRVRAALAEVRVDLRENPIPQDFTFDVRAFGSRVTLIVPPEVTCVFDVFALVGNAINQADEVPRDPSTAPRIHVTGSVFLGEVRVLVRARGA